MSALDKTYALNLTEDHTFRTSLRNPEFIFYLSFWSNTPNWTWWLLIDLHSSVTRCFNLFFFGLQAILFIESILLSVYHESVHLIAISLDRSHFYPRRVCPSFKSFFTNFLGLKLSLVASLHTDYLMLSFPISSTWFALSVSSILDDKKAIGMLLKSLSTWS